LDAETGGSASNQTHPMNRPAHSTVRRSRPLLPIALLAIAACSVQAQTAETYRIDPVHSIVEFKIRHLGISWVKGVFREFAGGGAFDPAHPENSHIEVIVQAASIDTGTEKRDTHLRSPDFFNAGKFPTLSFKSTKVEKLGANRYSVTGDFTLLDQTRPVTVEVETSDAAPGLEPGEIRRGGETAFKIKRSDFGMAGMVGPIGDEVQISLSFESVRE
jgi:polyisoprenoid-binding protein YceI